MASMKVVSIPAMENFANLIVYPAEQKVTNKQTQIKIFSIITFREKV